MGLFSRIEDALEKCHAYSVADRLRRFEMCFGTSLYKPYEQSGQLSWRENWYAEERKGFSILQREDYLKGEIRRLKFSQIDKKLISEEEAAELEVLEKELEGMGQMYWLQERVMGKLEREKPDGVWVRDWDAKQKRITEKMLRVSVRGVAQKIHPPQLELVKANGDRALLFVDENRRKPAITDPARQRAFCAQRGGCCARGRDCGCCEKYLRSHDLGVWAQGHCTMACGCCVKHRGFYRFDADTLASRRLGRRDLPWDSGI